MMAHREALDTETGPHRAGAAAEDCSRPMDDIQVSVRQAGLRGRAGGRASLIVTVSFQRSCDFLTGGLEAWPRVMPLGLPLYLGRVFPP